MENYIIISVIAVLALIGIRSTVKHFKGQGACCGGGGYRVKKKILTVSYAGPVDDELVISKVERLGYHILSNS